MVGTGTSISIPQDAPPATQGGPSNGYVAEDGATPYVAEDGATPYVEES
jgi:hypothetical protein